MADASQPIQQGRSAYQSQDGHVVDRALVFIENVPAGNIADALKAMPDLGSPHPEGLNAPLFSRAVVQVVNGTKMFGQETWDNRGGGGWFTGQLKKSSNVLANFDDSFEVRRYLTVSAGSGATVQQREIGVFKRLRVNRVETRIVRDAQGTGNVLAAIYSQIGHAWFKDGLNFVFLGGSVNDSGNQQNEYRVDYTFIAYGPVKENPLGAGDVPIPALDIGYQYQYVPTSDKLRVASVLAVPMWDENAQVLRLPEL